MTKVGIALGGGGVAGCAHLGVLQALEEEGIAVYCIAGTSSGALVAALYACGYSTSQIIHMVPNLNNDYLDFDYLSMFRKLMNRRNKLQGLLKGKKLRELLAGKTCARTMEELSFPVTLIASNLIDAKPTIFTSEPARYTDSGYDVVSHIEVADAIIASCSIPILFQPLLFENRLLVDGGLIDNCPISHARTLGADIVIAVNLCVAEPLKSHPDNLKAVLSRVISMTLVEQAKGLTASADVVLCPNVSSISPLDFSQTSCCIDEGYSYARKHMNEIRSAMEDALPKQPAIPEPSMPMPIPMPQSIPSDEGLIFT